MIRPRSPWTLAWPNILLAFLGGILVLRLVIWQFFRTTEVFFREEFSDLVVAFLILLLGILWLLPKLLNRQSFKKSGLELPIFFLIAAATGSLFYAPDFSSSLKGVLVLGAEVTFFYMLLDLIDTPSRLRWSLTFLLGMTFFVSVYGIITFFAFWMRPPMPEDIGLAQTNIGLYYLLVHHRAVSFLGWPNVLAGYLLLFLPLSIVLPFHLKKTWAKAAAMAGLFLASVCFLYTLSFLGWLSFLLSTIVLLPFFWKNLGIKIWPKEKKRMLFYGFFSIFILFILVILRKNFLMSLSPRLFYYKAAFLLLGQNPLWGYGWDSFGIFCRQLTTDTNNLSAYIHNSYLQIWLETGIIGFLGIVLLMVGMFRQAKDRVIAYAGQKDYWIFVAIAWGLMAFLIDNLFSYTILKPNVALYWWTMLAVFCAMNNLGRHSERSEESKGTLRSFAMLRMTVLILMFVFLSRIMCGYMLYYKAMSTKKPGSYSSALEMLNQAKALDPWSSYLPAGAASIHLEEYGSTRINNFLKLAAIDYLEAIRRSPKVYYNYFALSKIYEALGDTSRGQIFNQKAMELSPAEFALDNIMFHKSESH